MMNIELSKVKNFWFKLSDKIRFLVIGGFNAAFSYLIYSIILLVLGVKFYQLSLFLSWFLSSFVSFGLQRNLVFESKGPIIKEYLKSCTTWLFSYLINAGLLSLLVEYCKVNAFIAQLIANFTAAVFTYILFKLFVFRKK